MAIDFNNVRSFVVGPGSRYKWPGLCTTPTNGQHYTYYRNWPNIEHPTASYPIQFSSGSLEHLLLTGAWLEITQELDPDLRLDEGLK